MRPGAPPKSCGYVFTGPGEVFSSPTPPGPRWPPALWYFYRKFYVYTDVPHTPCLGRVVPWKMRWRWGWRGEWRWDEFENEVKDYFTRTRRGERKRRGREHTPTHLARSGQTLKRQGKRKAEGRRTRNKTSGGGEDGSAWTNLTRRKPTQTSARDGPDLPEEGRTHEIGDQWGTSWWKKKKQG